jgi:hypothetical protein
MDHPFRGRPGRHGASWAWLDPEESVKKITTVGSQNDCGLSGDAPDAGLLPVGLPLLAGALAILAVSGEV